MAYKHTYYDTPKISTLKEMVYTSAAKYQDKILFEDKTSGHWESTSYRMFLSLAEDLATALYSLGLKKGSRCALIGKNRTDWAISYMACAISGITVVPMDRELKEQELFHTLHLSQAQALICTDVYIDTATSIKKDLPRLKHIICMDNVSQNDVLMLKDMLEKGKVLKENGRRNALETEIDTDGIVSMLFTSGTTGVSKIVPLTNKNLCSNICGTSAHVYFSMEDKWLSVLPIHHVYECTAGFLIPVYRGAGIAFAESLYKLAENAKETRPTIMLGVPALFESILKKIYTTIKSKPMGSFKFALAKGICKTAESITGKDIRKKIFKELHQRFGGNIRLLITGGAPIKPEIGKEFNSLGFLFIQGAGMSETSPIIAVNFDKYYKNASIGMPVPGIEVKILSDNNNEAGEIAVRGDIVFNGYLNSPKINKEAFEDGWFKTGDLGYFDDEGFLYITGRKKNVIVTPGGKNIYPEEVESWINKSEFVMESLVWGGKIHNSQEEDVHAIVVPDYEYFDIYCKEEGLENTQEALQKLISSDIKKLMTNLSVYKRVKKFTIRSEEFPKTTTKKIKRYLVLSQLSGSEKI
jgi:long-chain acyl-CoA synthetase